MSGVIVIFPAVTLGTEEEPRMPDATRDSLQLVGFSDLEADGPTYGSPQDPAVFC